MLLIFGIAARKNGWKPESLGQPAAGAAAEAGKVPGKHASADSKHKELKKAGAHADSAAAAGEARAKETGVCAPEGTAPDGAAADDGENGAKEQTPDSDGEKPGENAAD